MECRSTFPGDTLCVCSGSPGIWGFLISTALPQHIFRVGVCADPHGCYYGNHYSNIVKNSHVNPLKKAQAFCHLPRNRTARCMGIAAAFPETVLLGIS